MYCIIDIETTGMSAFNGKITEIAIALHDGTKIIDTFETLINPECSIPYGITEITGIDNEMVADAPKFYEVAKKIIEMTEGHVFVAHNVRFDYSFVREEFRRLGYPFSRKKLDTVRLSRQAFPGLRSYSLGNLIRHFNIQVKDRHRAMADVMATVEIFEKILKMNGSREEISAMVNAGVKESLLPANINFDDLHALPEECGVYFFHDIEGQIVYVGKSINIQKRVMQHFAKKTRKAELLQKHVHEITYQITGSELVALILESYEIKRLSPPINRAQKSKHFPYMVARYSDDKGYLNLKILRNSAKARREYEVIAEFPKAHSAKNYLLSIREEHQLCNRLLNLETGDHACFYHQIGRCNGACAGKESPEDYNRRVETATASVGSIFDNNFIIIDRGVSPEEKTVLLVEDGDFRGFGTIDTDDGNDPEALKNAVKPFPHNPETRRIIHRFLEEKHDVRLIYF